MKKTLIFSAIALVALSACTKNETFVPDEEINFQVANFAGQTKSDPTALAGNTTFGVFAYHHVGTAWSALTALPATAYMNNVSISHNATDNVWAPASPYYWPKTGKLSFAGYAPWGANLATFSKTEGIKFDNWAIATAESATVGTGNKIDLLWSNETDSKNLTKDNAEDTHTGGTEQAFGHKGVPMLFHHALAKLNFNFVYDGRQITAAQAAILPIKVTDVQLLALVNKGSFASTENAWTLSTDNGDVALTAPSADLPTPADNAYGTAAEGSQNYFIIPQAPVTLQIKYTVAGSTAEEITATATLATSTITAWNPNYVYTYSIAISPVTDKLIVFDPAVEAWETVDGGTIDAIDTTPASN